METITARDSATIVWLSYGEGIGLAFDGLAGLSSTLAAAVILFLIFVSLTDLQFTNDISEILSIVAHP